MFRSFFIQAFAALLPFTNLAALPPAALALVRRFARFAVAAFTRRAARRTGDEIRPTACMAAVWSVIGLIGICFPRK